MQCSAGHVTRDFLSCDQQVQCGIVNMATECVVNEITTEMFKCDSSSKTIHYSQVGTNFLIKVNDCCLDLLWPEVKSHTNAHV